MSRFNDMLDWFERLSPANLDRLEEFYLPEAQFKDPFNDVTGSDAIRKIFEHMFIATSNPRFEILDRVAVEDQAFVTWLFKFGLNGKILVIRGATHFKLDAFDRVVLHRDYWDAAEELYEKLPLLSILMRWLRRRMAG